MKRIIVILLILVLLSGCTILLSPKEENTVEDYQTEYAVLVSRLDELEEKYDAVAKETDKLSADYDAVIEEKNGLKLQIDELQSQIYELQNQLNQIFGQPVPVHIRNLQSFISSAYPDLNPNALPYIEWLAGNEYSIHITCSDYEAGELVKTPDKLVQYCKEQADLVVNDISGSYYVREFQIAFLSGGVPAGYAFIDYVGSICTLMINGEKHEYAFN